MSKLEETNLVIDYITELTDAGVKGVKGFNLDVVNSTMLADIAKSLAMIADKLCGSESADKEG